MIRLIGTRWKRSNAWSQGVLIGRISCKECCTRPERRKISALQRCAQSKIMFAGPRVPLTLFSLARLELHSI
jgi:hypothetical protein